LRASGCAPVGVDPVPPSTAESVPALGANLLKFIRFDRPAKSGFIFDQPERSILN